MLAFLMAGTQAVLLAALVAGLLLAAPAQAAGPVQLAPGQSMERVDRQAQYLFAEPGQRMGIERAIAALSAGEFSSEALGASGSDPFTRELWIAIRVQNPATSGATSLKRVVGLGGIFVVLPQVYLLDENGQAEEILASKSGENGVLVPRYFNYVRTQSFTLPAGQERVILINTTHADRPTIGVFREGELGSNQVVATLIKAGFTFTMLIIGVVLAVIAIVTKRWIGLQIAVGFSLVMIQVDSSLFTTTFSASPWVGRQIWEAITLSATFFLYYSFLFIFRDKLGLDRHRWLIPIGALLPLPLIRVAWISDVTTDIIWAYYASLLMFACIIGFRFDIAPRLRMVAGGVMLTCVVGAVLVEPYYLGRYLPDLTIEYLRDGLRLLAAMGILLMVLADLRRTRLEQDRLVQERMEAFQSQAESDRRLLDAERDYARAREAASRRKRQLASASHDIRQPLVGLRQALSTESTSLSSGLQSRLGEAIDYLEHLTEEYSDRAAPDMPKFTEGVETYSLDLVLRTVDDMFRGEAEAGGVTLVVEPSTAQTQVPALALIRSVSNLVANALRHSGASQIDVRVLESDHCIIEVADNGRGFDKGDAQSFVSAGVKGESSDGDGLGLAIVEELANRHSFGFTIDTAAGAGTRARIELGETRAATK